MLSKIELNRLEYQKLAFSHLDREYVLNSPALKKQLQSVVEGYRGTEEFLITIEKYKLEQYNSELLSLVLELTNMRIMLPDFC